MASTASVAKEGAYKQERRLSGPGVCPAGTATKAQVSTETELKNVVQCANDNNSGRRMIEVVEDVQMTGLWLWEEGASALIFSANAKVTIVGSKPGSESPRLRVRGLLMSIGNGDIASLYDPFLSLLLLSCLLLSPSPPFFFLLLLLSLSLSLSLFSHQVCSD